MRDPWLTEDLTASTLSTSLMSSKSSSEASAWHTHPLLVAIHTEPTVLMPAMAEGTHSTPSASEMIPTICLGYSGLTIAPLSLARMLFPAALSGSSIGVHLICSPMIPSSLESI